MALVSGGVWLAEDGEPSGPAPAAVAAPPQPGPATTPPPVTESKAGQQPGGRTEPRTGPRADRGTGQGAGQQPGARAGQGAGQRAGQGAGRPADQARPNAPKPSAAKRPPAALAPSPPRQIAVPAITIEAPVVRLGLEPSGQLRSPPVENPHLTGWYEDGATPGEKGTAIMVGHRDTRKGPAVFLNLDALKPGNTVRVTREDGITAVFTVHRVSTFDKENFPDKEVYGPAKRPELRLLTCGGAFDRKKGYEANIVVFAHLTDTIPANA
ncbi:class F sortase [Streptomyces thermolilacinus]|uniref:class F sortase n=1 Tax=Streptomyces thermolilacinus TaxID=285540 RepID=UPI0003FC28C9|nr:class F sortase [Streptomyces thermolilacinus]